MTERSFINLAKLVLTRLYTLAEENGYEKFYPIDDIIDEGVQRGKMFAIVQHLADCGFVVNSATTTASVSLLLKGKGAVMAERCLKGNQSEGRFCGEMQ